MQLVQTFQPVSDVSNLGDNQMGIRDGFLSDAAKYFKGEKYQIDALNWLQSQTSDALLEKFAAEFSPPTATPKKSKYQLRFRLSPQNSDELVYGVLEFIKDGVVYNEIQATSSLPGRQYSGSWNRRGGLIPPTSMVKERTGNGLSLKTTPIYMPDLIGVSGNFYPIAPFEVQTDDATRGDWGFHRDANVPGSMGCIVPKTIAGWEAGQRELKALANLGIRSVELIVEYQ